MADEVRNVTDKRQLFVDDWLIGDMRDMRRVVHAVRKDPGNPILQADRPWEGQAVLLYGTVLRDDEDGLWKMWYMTYDHFRYMAKNIPEISHICYAESRDGIHWRKPELGVTDYRGHTENNIVLTGACNKERQYACHMDNVTVVKDPHETDPMRRYKMMIRRQTWDVSREVEKPQNLNRGPLSSKLPYIGIGDGPIPIGNYVLFSPDGIHWREEERPVMLRPVGDTLAVMYDERKRKHIAYIKLMVDGKRARFLSESDDFIRWSEPQPLLAADADDPDDTELYHNTGFLYEDMYLGFLTVWHRDNGNYLDVQLISSRDGDKWERVGDRSPVIPIGRPEIDWDFTSNNAASNPPVRVGEELWIYYCGRSSKHLHDTYGREPNKGAIGLGKLRLDGFVSLDAGERPGEVLTQPLRCDGGGRSLVVNAVASGGGFVAAEMTDADGKALPGFELAACEAMTSDSVNHVFRWNGRADLPDLSGAGFRIRFAVKQASVYSFQLGRV